MTIETHIEAVRTAPLDPMVHASLGGAWLDAGHPVHAVACLRTALALGAEDDETRLLHVAALLEAGRSDLARAALSDLPDSDLVARMREMADATDQRPPGAMDHNRFARMRTLSEALVDLAGCDDFSLLDIGGGDGSLALLLPRVRYVLAEPDTNGISGESLPFGTGTFDAVCACHVLEHVPAQGREAFLDSLLDHAIDHLVLLNPFRAPGVDHDARLDIVVDVTGAPWAREHRACGLPDLDEVTTYAERRGLECTVEPDGAVATGFLSTLLSHYARLAGRVEDLDRINRYLNDLPAPVTTNPRLPGGYLVRIVKDKSRPDGS